jgi:hypothetical protein
MIHFEPFTTNIHSKELNLFPMELAFLHIAKEFCILWTLKGIADSLDVLGFGFVVTECVIQVVLWVLIEEWHKHLIHVPLETGWGIHKTGGHNLHLIQSERHHKCYFPFILGQIQIWL